MPKSKKKKIYWAGFVDGEPAIEWKILGDSDEIFLGVYKSKKKALKHYEDVRPVEIKEIKVKKK
ncbi:MAG: hypothetical protein KGI27_12940 [Thaumarchaeota archaeon]|nr:hypothetical protein [Nitrososphaerota archaeon]